MKRKMECQVSAIELAMLLRHAHSLVAFGVPLGNGVSVPPPEEEEPMLSHKMVGYVRLSPPRVNANTRK